MCVSTSLQNTIQLVVESELFHLFSFKSSEEQKKIFDVLKSKDPLLYQSLDINKRTIFLRETGDNFRGASRCPTEQISFSILNLTELLSSPYGQFVMSLWRGSETRKHLMAHVTAHYQELTEAVQYGIELVHGNKSVETFNIVVFLCTDIGLLENILGKCSSISKFGCFWCKKPLAKWAENGPSKAEHQTVKAMVSDGMEAVRELGENPSHTSAMFTKFQQSHFGQYVSEKRVFV